MPEKQVFQFVPSARLQNYLGNQLIADPNLAIIDSPKTHTMLVLPTFISTSESLTPSVRP